MAFKVEDRNDFNPKTIDFGVPANGVTVYLPGNQKEFIKTGAAAWNNFGDYGRKATKFKKKQTIELKVMFKPLVGSTDLWGDGMFGVFVDEPDFTFGADNLLALYQHDAGSWMQPWVGSVAGGGYTPANGGQASNLSLNTWYDIFLKVIDSGQIEFHANGIHIGTTNNSFLGSHFYEGRCLFTTGYNCVIDSFVVKNHD